MARRHVLVLIIWLLCTHITTALAVIPQQQRVRKHPPVQCRSSVDAPFITCQVAGGSLPPNTSARQLPVSPTIVQDDAKKRRDITESMVKQRAWMYSAVLPGWGQVYNEHYWKVPVIYIGFVGLSWGAVYYHKEYVRYKQLLIEKKWGGSLTNYVDECRRDRDLCIIFAVLWYVVNIFDAYVGASLKTFTLSNDISMEVQPTVLPTIQKKPHIGLSLTLSFGK